MKGIQQEFLNAVTCPRCNTMFHEKYHDCFDVTWYQCSICKKDFYVPENANRETKDLNGRKEFAEYVD